MKSLIMDSMAMNRSIQRIAYEIIEKNKGTENLILVGVVRRGENIAQRLAEKISQLEKTVDVYSIDITNFRDDNKEKNLAENYKINIPIDDKKIIIVDDVFHTGRTIRAALDAICTSGRPKNVQLATLIDRGHREFPIRPDYVGKNLPTSLDENVIVHIKEIDGEDEVYIEK